MAALFAAARPVAVRSVSNSVRLVGCHRNSSNISAIDSFISDLVDNKKLKWKVLNSRHRNGQAKAVEELPKETTVDRDGPAPAQRTSFNLSGLFTELTQNPLVVNISSMDVPQVDHLIETALAEQNEGDVKLLLEQIVQYRKIPSMKVVDKVLRHVADLAETDKLADLIELFASRSIGKDATPVQKFDHYKALCLWKAGNTLKSLESFREIAKGSPRPEDLFLVDQILRELIDETIGKKSEAVLLAVMGLCEYCLTELRHEFPICYVWEKSFHSTWHSDQEAARTLFDRHVALRVAISKRVSNLCYKLLYDNNVEKVYQLMEHFLKHNMKPECTHILIRLFDYQYWRKNLRGCSEIMQNAVDLDISLPELYNRRLLELLLGRASLDPSVTGASKKPIVPKTRKYELKF
ncbi:uncharacterized protein LOC126574142 [Anopheles aquasalis]|uniref:uncharacterized protein LOC126574142 n=1 Tax=Anopheles aquasalis TaxID=42839 RepID=UPI00215A597A|nr:uncharacterized protein LOC126574142 [Anopheles aquasalis]